jgi:hypothetical protein
MAALTGLQSSGCLRRISVELDGLPRNGTHLLEFWWLDGDGAYAEAPLGQFSAWYGTPMQLDCAQRSRPAH